MTTEMSNDEYIHRQNWLWDIKPNQTVIAKKRFLNHVFGFERRKVSEKTTRVVTYQDSDEWYPFVNSFYNFTEDVDAFARVHHLLESKEASELNSQDICGPTTNEYGERQTQIQYLQSKPISFLILGKPGFGEEELGKRLAEFWNCVYIDPFSLLQEEIASKTRAGECIEFNLRCGRSIGIDVLTRLLVKKVQEPICLHRGFVCCGFPLVPNDLYQEDPISSESAIFTVREIFEDIIEETLQNFDISNKVAVSIAETEERDSVLSEVESNIRMSLESDFENQICDTPEISTDLQKQMSCVFGIFQEPYIIIYVAGRNPDVVQRRDGYFHDIYSNQTIDLWKINLFYELGAGDEDLVEDLFGSGRNPFQQNPDLRHLVKVPQNLAANINSQLDRYQKEILNIIDFYVLQHESQFYIKLDGRSYITQMMLAVKTRLELLPIQPVLLVQALGTEETDLEHQNTVSRRYKWSWSDWGEFCPISMSNMSYQKGSPKFSAHFSNMLYLLSNSEAFDQFVENPRPFLLPPFPRPPQNVFIFGPPVSGKTSVAKCLSYLLDSKILKPSEMHQEYLEQLWEEYREQVKQLAMVEAMEILKVKQMEEHEERKKEILEWQKEVCELLHKVLELFYERWTETTSIDVITSFPVMINQDEAIVNEEEPIWERLKVLNIPKDLDIHSYEILLEDRNALMKYFPLPKLKERSISILDPFVLEYANKKVDSIGYDQIKVHGNQFEMFIRSIRSCENWIIDGMPMDVTLFQQIIEEFPVFEVVILTTTNSEFLFRRYHQNKESVDFRNFRKFFQEIGEDGAAFRSPSLVSTDTYKHNIASSILNQILTKFFEEEQYEETVKRYLVEVESIKEFLSGLGIEPIIIDVNDLSIEELLKDVIRPLRDKYRRPASLFTDADRAEEIQQLFSELNQVTEGESPTPNIDDYLSKNRLYGDTLYYCPVAFAENKVLWRGRDKYSAKFKDHIYLCSNQTALDKFLKSPRTYLLETKPPPRFPPPRICIISPNLKIRSEMARALAKNLGIRYFSYIDLKMNFMNVMSTMSILLDSENLDIPDALVYSFWDSVFGRLWFEEPCAHVGFVLDGFPDTPQGMEYMVSRTAIPDVIFNIALGKDSHLEMELKRKLEEWRYFVAEQLKEQEQINAIIVKEWEESRKVRYQELLESKRQSRYSKQIELTSDTEISIDSVMDQQEQEDVTRILDAEYPEPVLVKNEETEDGMIEKFTTEILTKFDRSVEFAEQIQEVSDEHLIQFRVIDGGLDLEKIKRQLFIVGNEMKFRGLSFFERCYEISGEVAEKLLKTGYCFLSTFGRLCPVQNYEQQNFFHMYIAGRRKNTIFPIIHRQYIYFINGRENCRKFIKSPLKYTKRKNNFFLIPMIISIIGPPKSGKTSLSDRFKQDLGFRSITRGQAIRYVLSNSLYTGLINTIEAKLRKGLELNDEEVMECVQAATMGESISQGLIFDGFPNTISEMNELKKLGLIPHLIFDLKIDQKALISQALIEDQVLKFSDKFFMNLLSYWEKDQEFFRTWCDSEYQNVYQLKVDRSIWGLFELAKEVTCSVVFERKHYYQHVSLDWPLRLSYMLVTPLEFLERQSGYKAFCPGCLFYGRTLRNGGDPPDRTGLIQYKQFFYWFCPNHIEAFLKTPELFLPPSNITLPNELPRMLKSHQEPPDPYQDGFCVVCYQNGFPKKILIKGTKDFVVFYKNVHFMFNTSSCLNSFMANPEKLCNVTINFKESRVKGDLSYKELPVLGMLEQYVARTVVRAVSHTNVYRPIIPGLSISQSALICVGLNLKAHNEKRSDREKFEEALKVFHRRRSDLLKYLDLMKRYMNPFVHYEEPLSPQSSEEEFK